MPYNPCCNSCTLSLLKVEKVVKPPHTPTLNNKNKSLCTALFLLNMAKINPNKNEPAVFTHKVDNGKPLPLFTINETPYRNAPPIPLPMATHKNDFIVFAFVNISGCLKTGNLKYCPLFMRVQQELKLLANLFLPKIPRMPRRLC